MQISDTDFERQLIAYTPYIKKFARVRNLLAADDFLQNVYLQCWERRSRFDPSAGTVFGFVHWQCRAALNKALAAKVRSRREISIHAEDGSNIVEPIHDPDFDSAIDAKDIVDLLRYLRNGNLIYDMAVNGKSAADIADQHGYSRQYATKAINQVRARLVTALYNPSELGPRDILDEPMDFGKPAAVKPAKTAPVAKPASPAKPRLELAWDATTSSLRLPLRLGISMRTATSLRSSGVAAMLDALGAA